MYADATTTATREVPMKPLFGLVLILLLSACGGGDEPADDPAAKAAADPLAGTSWRLLHIRKTSIPEDITITGAGVTLVEEHDLWDMPVLFLLMLTLMGAEWAFRRVRGLV